MGKLHFLLFPFMSQGHTIPLLHLSRLLLRRSVSVTIFTTAANSPFIRASLRDVEVSVLELPFPQDIEGVPPSVENTEKLSVGSSFLPFVRATVRMQESFEQTLESLQPPVSCIVSDTFFWWSLESAERFRIPRLVFSGMGNFSHVMHNVLGIFRPHAGVESLDEPFPMPDFPRIKLTRNDFGPPFNEINPSGKLQEFVSNGIASASKSYGFIVNSFYELESDFIDYLNQKGDLKSWNISPLCLAEERPPSPASKPHYMKWLDERSAEGKCVLYISFGTQAEMSPEQYVEFAEGLERSEVCFLWVLKPAALDFLPGFEARVENRGLVAKDWVDQRAILDHEGVKGFLTHCGWNSVVESISAGVPILALPLMAEQHVNARFVVEEIGVALRIMPRGGSMRGHVEAAEVERKVREIMGGGKVAAAAAAMSASARDAMKEGGSSWCALDMLLEDIHFLQNGRNIN